MPDLVVIAGPNGAGKSTAAPWLLRDCLGIKDYVNADVIASGLSGFRPESVAAEAGRIMLQRLRSLADAGRDFAFETTLASRSFAAWIVGLKRDRGYRFFLVFLSLPDPELAVRRVAIRVKLGGHSIPEDVILRRHGRGIANLRRLYAPIADWWGLYDSSVLAEPLESGTAPGIQALEVTEALREGGREARRRHRAMGQPIVTWRDGKVLTVPPGEIAV